MYKSWPAPNHSFSSFSTAIHSRPVHCPPQNIKVPSFHLASVATAPRLLPILKMPALAVRHPTIASNRSSSTTMHKHVNVGFLEEPVSGVSRPVDADESWATYEFEAHARRCAYCYDPYHVYKARDQLCAVGHHLAQAVARLLYIKDGIAYSTHTDDIYHRLVRVELPKGYHEVRGLLEAVERSLRHRSRQPFVVFEHSRHTASRARPVKIEQGARARARSRSRPRSGEIVDWPSSGAVETIEVTPARSMHRRGSLYIEDLAEQRRKAERYRVEVREPSRGDVRERRRSGYYR